MKGLGRLVATGQAGHLDPRGHHEADGAHRQHDQLGGDQTGLPGLSDVNKRQHGKDRKKQKDTPYHQKQHSNAPTAHGSTSLAGACGSPSGRTSEARAWVPIKPCYLI
jgi:hypothetical protein